MTNLVISLMFTNLPSCFIIEASVNMTNWVEQMRVDYYAKTNLKFFIFDVHPAPDKTFWRWKSCL